MCTNIQEDNIIKIQNRPLAGKDVSGCRTTSATAAKLQAEKPCIGGRRRV